MVAKLEFYYSGVDVVFEIRIENTNFEKFAGYENSEKFACYESFVKGLSGALEADC